MHNKPLKNLIFVAYVFTMSKRDLKKYVSELKKNQLEELLLELYDKFPEVKTYYNFVFRPNENNLLKDAKIKISNEYFPIRGKRPKMRRGTAQKFIKHFITLGVDAFVVADVMLYSVEIAQLYCQEKTVYQESFYKSMLNSYQSAVSYVIEKGILDHFKKRVEAINSEAISQNWPNNYQFNAIIERLQY
jgi:putative NIF3 family GTP cyclohydrolase 1 type 2